MPEDEEKKHEELKEQPPSEPAAEEEPTKEEDEMDNKSLTKAIREMQKTLKTQEALINDLSKSLKKSTDGTGDETNTIPEKKEKASGEVAAGTEVSMCNINKDFDFTFACSI